MLKKFFKKEFTNKNFINELLSDVQNFKWLEEALDTNAIDINFQDNNKNTFLMVCIKKGKYQSAMWLLEHEADPTILNKELKAAIDLAIEKNKTSMVEALLKHKDLDINQKDEYGRSLLQNMVVSGNLSMAKVLISSGANINTLDSKGRHVMYDALSYGDHDFVEYLLSHEHIELDDIDEDGITLMQHPQIEQNDRLAQDLLVAGANPTLLNSKGESYLFKTALRGKEANPIIDVALENGADVNAKTTNENTIMMELVYRASNLSNNDPLRINLLQIVSKMVDYNGNINALNKEKETALFNAVRLRDLPLIKFLLASGIDPNIQNQFGQTVLEDLVFDAMEYVNIIKVLLTYGIDPTISNKHGKTVYEILTDIILHIDGSVLIEEEKLVQRIDPDGLYMNLVQLFLDNQKLGVEEDATILEFFDSHGDPLFFRPLMNNNFALFRLYTLYPINLYKLNKSGHNIFFSYVLRTFENDIDTPKVCKNFQDNISSLISRKVNKDFTDSLGWTIVHKIMSTNCNIHLFKILVETVKFDYTVTANLGRSVVHNAVWSDKLEALKILNKITHETLNVEDIYGIPPVYYAALLGNKKMVLLFLDLGVNIDSPSKIDPRAIRKFSPMLKNLEDLRKDEDDLTNLNKINSLVDIVEKKFGVKH